MDSIVGFAANGSGLLNVDSEVMPTNFSYSSQGRRGPPSETPGQGRPPCPPNNPTVSLNRLAFCCWSPLF